MKDIRDEIRERYYDLFEHSLDLVYVNDMLGNFIDANKITLETLGYEINEFRKLSFKDFLDQSQVTQATEILKEIAETGGQSKSAEFKIKTKDGNYVYVETFGIPIRKESKTFGILGIAKNITELRNAQEKLQRSEKKYRFLFQTTPYSIVLLNNDGIIMDCNPTTERMFGYKKSEIQGRHFSNVSIIHQKFLPPLLELFDKILKGEEVHRIDIQIYRKDGTLIWTNLQAAIVKIGSKTFVQTTFHDITRQKNITQKLIESEDLYKTLVKTSPDAIIVTDLKGKIIEISEKAIELYGANSADDLIGKNSFDFIVPHDKKKAFENLKRTLEGELVKSEFILLKKNGDSYISELHTNLIKDVEGKPKAFIGILRDITERKRAEQLLKESEEQYRHLYENAPIALWTVRISDGKFIRGNESAAKIVGYDNVEEFLNQSSSMEIVDKEYRRQFLTKLKQEGEISGMEAHLTDKKGIAKYIAMSAKIYEDQGLIEGVSTDITDLKKAQKDLQDSEKKYRHLFDISPNLIILLNLKGMVFDANRPFFNFFGHQTDELIGTNIFASTKLFPKNKVFFESKFHEFLEKGALEPFEVQVLNKDQNYIWVNLQTSFINLDGQTLIQIILQDIDERKKAEQKLKESEEIYRHLFENSPNMLFLLTLDGIIKDVNEHFLKKYDYQKQEIVEKDFRSFGRFDQSNVSTLNQKYQELIKKGTLEPFELVFIDRFGKSNWINLQGSLIKIEDIQFILIIMQDITEKRKAEDDLRESESKFRKIFEAIPDFYFLIDNEGTILDFKGKREDFIIPPEQFVANQISDFFPREFVDLAMKKVDMTIESKQPSLIEYNVSIRGELRHFEARFLYFSRNQVALFLREITERKKAELLIQEEYEKVKELEQIRKDLISRVSHELKTPLIPVISGSELLKTIYHDQLGDEATEIIELIDKGGRRLKELVEQLLNVSRIEYSKFEVKKERCKLNDIVKECVNDMKFLLENRKISINVENSEELYLEMDKIRIGEVITNLLSNAIKNTPPDGKIYIKLEKQTNWAVLSVKDTGVGLTEREMHVLFTRFGKIDRYNEGLEYIDIKGSGLGLYICKGIVDLHGGEVWAESPGRNKGSTFFVRLPLN